ncbi:hypothetical protein ACJIZ3_007052 [Penstemon smallii]|uniref:Coiled-coil domain-containing protein 22 homolog n=1 Tax=Penstemon smallii TaxID=265156 RepID=A0ABD3S9I1_9LAMI
MEESEEILLVNLGVPIPPGVSSVHDLTPETLYTLCSHALSLIGSTSPFPPSLPEDSMADRVKACTDLASAVRNLGFIGDLSFHTFLYPSEEDLYKLVRFLQRRLSESRTSALWECGDENRGSTKEEAHDEGVSMQNGDIFTRVKDLRLANLVPQSSNMKSKDEVAQKSDVLNSVLQNVEIGVEASRATEQYSSETQSNTGDDVECSSRGIESLGKIDLGDQDCAKEVLQNQEEMLKTQMNAKSSELRHLEEELQLLKAAEKMAFDGQQPIEFHIEQLTGQVEAKKYKLNELESEWDVMEKTLREKERILKKSLLELYPEAYAKLTRRKEIELETESVLAEIKRREEEISKLSSDLEKQPKLPSRRSYIERINEIAKNSRKQDTDIQQILKDTRELQLESNTIQERLNRTYAVVEETIFRYKFLYCFGLLGPSYHVHLFVMYIPTYLDGSCREAKKDPVARQAYRLLTNIHDSFEQITEKILATDRSRRDFADYESKLAGISVRSLNIGKIKADLDAIRKENEVLEQRLRNV